MELNIRGAYSIGQVPDDGLSFMAFSTFIVAKSFTLPLLTTFHMSLKE